MIVVMPLEDYLIIVLFILSTFIHEYSYSRKTILYLKLAFCANQFVWALRSELNVKHIEFDDRVSEYVTFKVKPNPKALGKRLEKVKAEQEIASHFVFRYLCKGLRICKTN